MTDSDKLRRPVECIVKVNDREIVEFYPFLREARVRMSRRAATTATLTFDSARLEDGKWSVQDADVFGAWKRISIEAAFGDRREEVMRGYIREVHCDYPEDMSAAHVVIDAQDESLLLDREHVRRSHSTEESPQNDQAVVKDIAGKHKLKVSAEQGLTNTSLNQDQTDVRFLHARADANGYEFYVRGGTLFFHPPKLNEKPVKPIRIYAGAATNCLRFSAWQDGHKPDVVLLTRAPDSGTEIKTLRFESKLTLLGTTAASNESQKVQEPFAWFMRSGSGATAAEQESRAQAKANENAWKIAAQGELDGALYGHVLLTYQLVTVDGAGSTYSGTYYVDEVEHRFSLEGYRLEFRLLRNATGDDGVVERKSVLDAVLGSPG